MSIVKMYINHCSNPLISKVSMTIHENLLTLSETFWDLIPMTFLWSLLSTLQPSESIMYFCPFFSTKRLIVNQCILLCLRMHTLFIFIYFYLFCLGGHTQLSSGFPPGFVFRDYMMWSCEPTWMTEIEPSYYCEENTFSSVLLLWLWNTHSPSYFFHQIST